MRQVKDTKFKMFKADLRSLEPSPIKINGNINAKYTQILKQVLSKQDLSINLKGSCAQILLHRWERLRRYRQSQATNPLGSSLTNAWQIERGESAKL